VALQACCTTPALRTRLARACSSACGGVCACAIGGDGARGLHSRTARAWCAPQRAATRVRARVRACACVRECVRECVRACVASGSTLSKEIKAPWCGRAYLDAQQLDRAGEAKSPSLTPLCRAQSGAGARYEHAASATGRAVRAVTRSSLTRRVRPMRWAR
jgi:hypothetical protein